MVKGSLTVFGGHSKGMLMRMVEKREMRELYENDGNKDVGKYFLGG